MDRGLMRLGLLGGTFDPIHLGHLDVGSAARRAMQLDRVWLLPSGVPPHRRPPQAPATDRLAMAKLAAAERPGFEASDLELRAPGPSYTSATIDRVLASGLSPADVFFVIGADAFREIETWMDYPRLLDRCHFVVVSRPGCPVTGLRAALPALADRMRDAPCEVASQPGIFLVDAPTPPVSSSDVRRRIGAGASIEGLVPAGVAAYITAHGLYRQAPA
jgi:nicotinate-nucleotide adenylyltransferase